MAANEDVIEFTLVWDYQGSTILNVYHFQLREFASPPDTEEIMNDLDSWMEDNVYGEDAGKLVSQVVEDMTLIKTRGQIVKPNRDRYYEFPKGFKGGVEEAGVPSNVALVLKGQTDAAVRGASASKHFTGFPVSALESEFWNAPLQDAIAGAHDAMVPFIANAGPIGNFVPVTLKPISGFVHDIVDWSPIPTVRVMGRRTKGYGI